MWRDFILPYCGSNANLFFACPSTRGYPWYGYNRGGTQGGGDPSATLGLGAFGPETSCVPESRVLAPSDMIAVLHDAEMDGLLGFGWPGNVWWDARSFHRSGENALFCDGHVESEKFERIPQRTVAGWLRFVPDRTHASRWNNDNRPHRRRGQTINDAYRRPRFLTAPKRTRKTWLTA